MQLNVLWQFMQIDMQADQFEVKMRQSENRQKLLKQRNFLLDQQANIKKIEEDVVVMKDRLEAVEDEAKRLEKVVDAAVREVENNPPKDIEEARARIENIKKTIETLSRYEQELQKIRKDAEQKDRQQKEIRTRAAKTKAEYEQLKAVYDKEYRRDKAQLDKMRSHTEAEAAKVDEVLMSTYRRIKQHCTPPMARLISGQCSGCFMSLPSATLLELKEGKRIVECDNCGRIIYVEE